MQFAGGRIEGNTGFRFDELSSAFDLVRDGLDWQAPIRAEIDRTARPVVEQAVLYFTSTTPHFDAIDGADDRMLVTALGYRLGPVGRS